MNVPLLDQKLIDLLTQLYPAAQRDYAKQQAAPVPPLPNSVPRSWANRRWRLGFNMFQCIFVEQAVHPPVGLMGI